MENLANIIKTKNGPRTGTRPSFLDLKRLNQQYLDSESYFSSNGVSSSATIPMKNNLIIKKAKVER